MTNDIDTGSDLEEIPKEQNINSGASGKGKKFLFNMRASNEDRNLSRNEREEDDLRQFERPTSYFKPRAKVRRPLHSGNNY